MGDVDDQKFSIFIDFLSILSRARTFLNPNLYVQSFYEKLFLNCIWERKLVFLISEYFKYKIKETSEFL